MSSFPGRILSALAAANQKMEKSSDRQSAVRLLACIAAGGRDPEPGKWNEDIVAILDGQARLQALDFWMRYPDYLANELLNAYENDGVEELFDTAKRIFDDREPDLRHLPMIRYHFGAFEPLDNALAILRAADLIRVKRIGQPGHIQRHLYLLTHRGLEAMETLANAAPELAWYRDRAQLVADVAGGQGGTALKDRQYLQREYAETDLSQPIRSISDRVLDRIKILESEDPA